MQFKQKRTGESQSSVRQAGACVLDCQAFIVAGWVGYVAGNMET